VRLSDELTSIIRDDSPSTTNYSNTALLYVNRLTFDIMKSEMTSPAAYPWETHANPLSQLFGIPLMRYHGIPDGRWELVQRSTGERITSGDMWEGLPGAVKNDPVLILRDLHAMISAQDWTDEHGKRQVLTGIHIAIKAIQ